MTAHKTNSMFDQPLLVTKISPPHLPNRVVQRPRLTGRIHQGVQRPLTLLAAPAGFGKTCLLMEWRKETNLPVAWLMVDPEDNDPQRFFSYLIGAFQTLAPGLGEKTLEFLQFSRGSNLEVGLTLFINELFALPKEIALVLDDFQFLEQPAVLQGINYLLKYLPSNLHLLIASRSEPDLDLAFLRAKGRVVELKAEDLRFTGEEVGQYVRQLTGLKLSAEQVQALRERTDGWITALQLAVITLESYADPAALLDNRQDFLIGKGEVLTGFLAEEVLNRQPEEVRQFLLKTSILEMLSGPLCDAVACPEAQPGTGASMLNRLKHDNLFLVALDGNDEWFRYHPLFAGFLRQIMEKGHSDELLELHQRAALWFEGNDSLDDAFRHALASQDMTWTADLIERNLHRMVKTGEISAFNQWMDKLPEEILHQRPFLSLAYAWSLIAARQIQLARYWLDDVRLSLSKLEKQAGADRKEEQDHLQLIRAGLAVCHASLEMLGGDLEQAAALYQQASSILPEENAYARSFVALEGSLSAVLSGDTQKAIDSLRATMHLARQGNNPLVLVISASALADMQAQQGQLTKAWETLQHAQYLVLGPGGRPLPLSGLLEISQGEILLEQDLLEEAREHLERGCEVTQSMWYLGSLHGVMSLARLCQAQGDIARSQITLEVATRMALESDSGEWDATAVASAAVRLALQRDDLAAAELWWKKGGLPNLSEGIAVEAYPYHVYEYLLLTQARFLLVKGQVAHDRHDLQRASDLLESISPTAQTHQRVTSQIEILVLLALAQFALGMEGAQHTLLQALALAEPEGYRRVFLDESRHLLELLRQCWVEQRESGSYFPSLAFINGLLEDIQHARREAPVHPQAKARETGVITARLEDGFPIGLSARELEVLQLIAAGKSNQEISDQLYLALNTTKRHAYNIFAKLEVSKRTQAVMKARQLGLIS